jgi:Uma2 family endonuclease
MTVTETYLPGGVDAANAVRPEPGQPWTIEDLELLPYDDFRYEIIEGSLLVTPMPANPHWRATYRLRCALEAQAPAQFVVSGENPGILIGGGHSYLIPDLVVLHAANVGGDGRGFEPAAYGLVVEVLSPSNRSHDLVTKRHHYGRAGIAQYWIVDPKLRQMAVLVHDGQGGYTDSAVVTPDKVWHTGEPFPIELDLNAVFD